MDNVEEFCVGCDTSSNESGGVYIDNVWHCDKCKVEGRTPENVSNRMAKDVLGKVLEKLEEFE